MDLGVELVVIGLLELLCVVGDAVLVEVVLYGTGCGSLLPQRVLQCAAYVGKVGPDDR